MEVRVLATWHGGWRYVISFLGCQAPASVELPGRVAKRAEASVSGHDRPLEAVSSRWTGWGAEQRRRIHKLFISKGSLHILR